jgi:acetyltransferase
VSFTESYPAQYESNLTLRNGSVVFLRPIKATDGDIVIDLVEKLSSNSKYLRFLRSLDSLSENLLYQLTHVNYISEFALVAAINEGGNERIITVARYAYSSEDNNTELAVTVRDDWQHHGLGKSLLERIVEISKEHGISQYVAIIAPQNKTIINTLIKLGYNVNCSLKSGIFHVEIAV